MRRALYMTILLLSTIGGERAPADQILSSIPDRKLYAVGIDPGKKSFRADDLVCLFVDEVKVVCGDVFKASGKGILLFVTDGTTKLQPGTQVDTQYQIANPRSRIVSAGMNYYFPHVHFQQHIAARLAYGFMGEAVIYSRPQGKVKGIIAMMTMSYYGKHLFQGPWIMGGLGLHFLNKQAASAVGDANRDGITSLVGQLNLGWRFRIDKVSIGAAVGAQYWMDPNLHPLTLKEVPGLLPSVILDIGYIF